ncbi:transcription factor domain-containing protein [Aspergillus lucknowensis]|uniref:Xylanolytic transcriptional activator regulatory domain-containing protein n=1 Tax=Aspergillus lucknowensis TaxID=176173 RepID=A0ABR4LPA0_9EURO
MELTWLADTPQSRRRTRALRACPSCQKRKKRCYHLVQANSTRGPTARANIPNAPGIGEEAIATSPRPETSQAVGRPVEMRGSAPSSGDIPRIERFVGDLNPEAAIRENIDAVNGTHLRDRVGLWINAAVPQSHEGRGEISDAIHVSQNSPGVTTVGSIVYQRCLSALKAWERLPHSTLDHLVAIYFSRVNHILPLVDHESFTKSTAKGTASVLLEKAVCLVAAKDHAASPHLRLIADGPVMTARNFCSELYNGLVCAMDAGLEGDRVSRIRILALMSLHPEGHEGAEAASMHLCHAIHQAQTAGLHLQRPNRLPGDPLTNLFWCLWTLDKMHASIGGRPVLLADRDIGIIRPDVTRGHPKSAFDVWFTLSELLSTVISFYRPSADDTTGWEADYPSFEEVMGDHVRGDLDFVTLGVLELYYHAISILSCRYRPPHRPEGSRPSYTRQGLAAIRIYSLVATECARILPPLPIVPYAVALSMGVSYQQFRTSKIITHFDRARASLEACCSVLEELGPYWYSAEAMARLGRKALRQIEGATTDNNQSGNGVLLSAMNHDRDSYDNAGTLVANQEISAASTRPPVCSTGPHRPFRDGLLAPVIPGSSARLPLDEKQGDMQSPVTGDGFADIDMLFDDFLDLSLPTNFWDPVFFPPEDHRENG